MALTQVMEVYDLLDSPMVNGAAVESQLRRHGAEQVLVTHAAGERGATDFVQVTVPGSDGKLAGGAAPTLGIIGRLGGIGARPHVLGLVSDADGAIVALAAALVLLDRRGRGDVGSGDVIISTHVCPNAHIVPRQPVPMMSSPVDMDTMNRHDVSEAMDAILSVDTTKGNRIVKHKGFAISPTVKEGYILPVSDDLLTIAANVSGLPPRVLPLSTQDITPYGNGLPHVNSIVQPATATSAPVVGVALTSEAVVPGSAGGASDPRDMDVATRFLVEVAAQYGRDICTFYNPADFARLVLLYGSMARLQGSTGR